MILLSVAPKKGNVVVTVYDPDPRSDVAADLHEWLDGKGKVLDDSYTMNHGREMWVFVPREEHERRPV
jgi:hypothetical protein